MKKRPSRLVPEVSLSFLDVISCGFGAIVLLLIIARTVESTTLEEGAERAGQVRQLQEQLFAIRGETDQLQRELRSREEQLSAIRERVARLREQLASLEKQQEARAQVDTTEKDELTLALQVLTEEMERLLARDQRVENNLIGGVPVDSEYIIFIVDTSGSMFNYAWSRLRREMINILEIHPTVKGIQIMNDMGDYMFPSYAGDWIPDTEGRRRIILNRLANWTPFSNSSPVEGIQRAISSYYAPDKKISLYVFGDDFTGDSIHRVVEIVDKINRERLGGERLVRIHTIGFPVHFLVPGGRQQTATRYAALMRELSFRNDGTFIGLNSLN